MIRWIAWVALLLASTSAAWGSGNVIIYDDASQNGFNEACSYNATWDFANTSPVHGGTHSISFAGSDYGALSWCTPTTESTSGYQGMSFWVNGGASGGQNIKLLLGLQGNVVKLESITTLLGHAISANAWEKVSVSFDSGPFQFSGDFDQISLQDYSGNPADEPQPTVYFDDVTLIGRVPDKIFKDGFDGDALPPPACGMSDHHDVTVDSMLSDTLTWCDAAGEPRSATLAHNDDPPGPGGSRGGELREFRYEIGGDTRIITAPHRSHGGFGYIVSHSFSHIAHCDDSYLGHSTAGTWTRVFEGRHHAIFRFEQNYRRRCTIEPPATDYYVPVTIDWIFSTGRDNPIWAVTYDVAGSGVSANVLADDSRAPYGTLNIDGTLNGDGTPALYMDHTIAGVAWGDRYRYSTTDAFATPNSRWIWSVSNTVPFVKLWTAGADAAMGLVQSQTMDQQDAGGGRQPYGAGTYDVSSYWGMTSANGQACPDDGVDQQLGVAHNVPCIGFWPYQLVSYNYYQPGNLDQPTNDAQMTWGTQYGFLGQSGYELHDSTLAVGSTASGYPKKSYSVYIVLGAHSTAPVDAQRIQVETMQTASFSATVGSVATSGPAGVNRADTITYDPAGYDPIYGALTFSAAGDALDANVAVGTGALTHPLIIVRGYGQATYPATVKLNGAALAIDVDYFPSLRTSKRELWITLNRDLTGPTNHLEISP